MAQDYKPGEIVPQSGVYRITHDGAYPINFPASGS